MSQDDLQSRDASSRFVWPPVIYTASCLAAYALHRLVPLPLVPAELLWPAQILGAILGLAGLAVAGIAEVQFLLARTATLPVRPTSAIVATGVYRISRNPMYLGMSLVTAALGFWLNALWFLAILPLAVVAVTKLAIEREERYLERKFGDGYLAYKNGTRRWL
ncbi:MAG: isoprenylcysteine carboxylmethyltransferase family protein [Beijerinckiaceae bacterium]